MVNQSPDSYRDWFEPKRGRQFQEQALVYILYSERLKKFYTGITTDLKQRLEFHQNAASTKFTHNANDWTLYFHYKNDGTWNLKMRVFHKTQVRFWTQIITFLKNK